MGFSLPHILLILVVVLVVFGAGRLPQVMGDLGKGMRNFKSGLNTDDKSAEKTENDKLPPPAA
jgi:sec-independent protein translocase protein TatA